MEKEFQRFLRALDEIEKNHDLSQRALADKLGIALGLTNSVVKRLAKKGCIKVMAFPKNKLRYLITPKGLAEKSRLTYAYLQHTIDFYKDTRSRIKECLIKLASDGVKTLAFYVAGEVAEICLISLHETDLELIAIADDSCPGKKFLGFDVVAVEDLKALDFDKLIITSFVDAQGVKEKLLQQGVPEQKVCLL